MTKPTVRQLEVLAYIATRSDGVHVREPYFTIGRNNGKARAALGLERQRLITRDEQNPQIYRMTDAGREIANDANGTKSK